MKYRERVLGLILVSPLCKAPSWSEWFYNKVFFFADPVGYSYIQMSVLLFFSYITEDHL